MNWAALNISHALTQPRPTLDLVFPGRPVATVGNLVAPGATCKTQFLLQLAVSRCLGLLTLGRLFPQAAPEMFFSWLRRCRSLSCANVCTTSLIGLLRRGSSLPVRGPK